MGHGVERLHVTHLEGHAQLQMVLQIGTHTRQIVHNRNAVLLQQRAGADARALQNLRAVDRTGGEYRFAPRFGKELLAAVHEFNAGDAPAVEAQAFDLRVGHHGEIGTRECRFEKSLRRADTHAAALVDFKTRGTGVVTLAGVEIFNRRDTGFLRRIAKGIENFPLQALALDAPFAPHRRRASGLRFF